MNKTGIIVSGGNLDDKFVKTVIEEISPQYLIAVDRGLLFFYRNGMLPTHIVGDFDSVDENVIDYYKKQNVVPIREFDPVKDASDTEIAVNLAMELEVERLWLLGATGTRLDHVMANIQLLYPIRNAHIEAYLLDSHNKISLHDEKQIVLKKKEAYGTYFSIFPFDGKVENVSIQGAKYPLENYTLMPYDSRCVSNEWKEEEVVITFSSGKILLMETKDR